MNWPAVPSVVGAHERVLAATGGAPGLRDPGLLDSALHRPLAAFAGQALYPDLVSRAGALLDGLVRNHAFVDGNKRTAVVVVLSLLDQAGLVLDADDATVEDRVVALAEHRLSLVDLTGWLRAHVRPRPTG